MKTNLKEVMIKNLEEKSRGKGRFQPYYRYRYTRDPKTGLRFRKYLSLDKIMLSALKGKKVQETLILEGMKRIIVKNMLGIFSNTAKRLITVE